MCVCVCSANVTAVESREELEALKNNHDVLFMLVYDGKVDSDWHKTYSKVLCVVSLCVAISSLHALYCTPIVLVCLY